MKKKFKTTTVRLGLLAFALFGFSGCQQIPSASSNMQGVRDFQASQYEAAAQQFRSATLQNPSNPDAFYNLGSTLHQLSYVKAKQARTPEDDDEVRDLQIQAESTYLNCLKLNEEHVECHRGLAVLLVEMGRSEQAFTLLQRWSVRSPESVDARVELARMYEEHGDLDTAKLHLHQAMNIGPANSRAHARAWAATGLIREREGEIAQAQQNFQQAYALNRDQPGVGTHLAALNRRIAADASLSNSGDTRTVTSPRDHSRY